jgi:hypothetical protein
MSAKQSTRLPGIAALVQEYQDRWQICLDGKTHSYYWLERFVQ